MCNKTRTFPSVSRDIAAVGADNSLHTTPERAARDGDEGFDEGDAGLCDVSLQWLHVGMRRGFSCNTRSGCDHHFFGNATTAPPILLSFGTLIPNLASEISNSKKIGRTGH